MRHPAISFDLLEATVLAVNWLRTKVWLVQETWGWGLGVGVGGRVGIHGTWRHVHLNKTRLTDGNLTGFGALFTAVLYYGGESDLVYREVPINIARNRLVSIKMCSDCETCGLLNHCK